jgi:hypothetical protein
VESEPVIPVRTPLYLYPQRSREVPEGPGEGEIDHIGADEAVFRDFDYVSRGRGVRGDPSMQAHQREEKDRKRETMS